MDEQIKQIGERLKGLRDMLDIPAGEIAALCGVSVNAYLKVEAGEAELSISNMRKISRQYDITLDAILFGEEPLMSAYFLTRKGQGLSVERREAYKYQSLASGFRKRKAEPFLVKVEPSADGIVPDKNSHEGQEFDIVASGTLEITIGDKTLTLNEGDSIYFDAKRPHCMRAIGDKPVEFLAIIL